jgi:hypothetical protein
MRQRARCDEEPDIFSACPLFPPRISNWINEGAIARRPATAEFGAISSFEFSSSMTTLTLQRV